MLQKITTDVNIDLRRPGVPPTLYAKQDDSGTRSVHIIFFDGGQKYVAPTSATIVIRYAAASGACGAYDTIDGASAYTWDSDHSGVTIDLVGAMLAEQGVVAVDASIVDGNQQISTFSVNVIVERSAAAGTPAEDYFGYTALNELANRVGANSAYITELQEADNATNARVSGLEANPALEVDLSADFAASGGDDAVEYLVSAAQAHPNNALLRVSEGDYTTTARCIRNDTIGGGEQYIEVTQYTDEGSVERSVWHNGTQLSLVVYQGRADGGKLPVIDVPSAAKALDVIPAKVDDLGNRVSLLEGLEPLTSWADVQKIVRAGLASRYFAIGDQLQCKRGDKVLTWDVIGIDHDTPADPKYKHSLTLQLHDCMEDKYPFDAAEPTNPDADRKLYGSNNWSESGIRQWLNSAADPGTWWQAKTAYDAPPNYASSDAGFMQGLDADFLASVGEVSKVTAKNTVTDGSGSDTTTERFFLLSLTEIYGGLNNAISEGAAYPYYSDSSALTAAGTNPDTNRIKYRNGTPEYWWLRSPNCQFSPRVRYGTIRGSISNDRASSKYGVAPACCII